MQRGCVSAMPFINWGQVISVTAENVLGADNVMLTFLRRKAQIRNHKKSPRKRGGVGKWNCFSTVLFKNENQSASSRSHSQPHRDAMNINISDYKCDFLLEPNALNVLTAFVCMHIYIYIYIYIYRKQFKRDTCTLAVQGKELCL